MTLQQMKDYIDAHIFKTFDNTDDFPELTAQEKQILKEIGIVNDGKYYPYYNTDGKLTMLDNGLIKIGERRIFETPLCIDINDNHRIVGFRSDTSEKYVINSNLETYIKCLYVLAYYVAEYEKKEVYGEYYKNQNYKKYAKKFRELLNEVEPGIEKYIVWENTLSEMELGVI